MTTGGITQNLTSNRLSPDLQKPIKKLKDFITTLTFLTYPLTVTAQEGPWELVLENDAKGSIVSGGKEELIIAVRKAPEVRIYWKHESPENSKIKVEHLAPAKSPTIMSGETVFAQIDPIVGQTPDFDEQELKLRENLSWSLMAGTNGKFESMVRNAITGEMYHIRSGK